MFFAISSKARFNPLIKSICLLSLELSIRSERVVGTLFSFLLSILVLPTNNSISLSNAVASSKPYLQCLSWIEHSEIIPGNIATRSHSDLARSLVTILTHELFYLGPSFLECKYSFITLWRSMTTSLVYISYQAWRLSTRSSSSQL